MHLIKTFLIFLVTILNFLDAAPSVKLKNAEDISRKNEEVEHSLEHFLNVYYEEYLNQKIDEEITKFAKNSALAENEGNEDFYDRMQGDQPAAVENNVKQKTILMNSSNLPSSFQRNMSEVEYIRTMRNRRKNDLDERTKENWIQILKDNILRQIGRGNMSIPKGEEARLSSINISQILPNVLNSSNLLNDDQITEKIRSFYPSCEVPVNTDQDIWKDDDIMNLYFNFSYGQESRNTNIATATLRLYRLPQNGTKFSFKKGDCDTFDSTEEDKLLRVSIYWYTKSLKKRRVKRRLSDSKVVSESSRWVELSVKPATKAWGRGRNLGLGVLVEDQEGNTLRADKYFKGASCMQPPSQFQPLSLTQPGKQTNLTEFIAYLEEIQRQPFIVTYNCYQQ